jgi:hypothetical protein
MRRETQQVYTAKTYCPAHGSGPDVADSEIGCGLLGSVDRCLKELIQKSRHGEGRRRSSLIDRRIRRHAGSILPGAAAKDRIVCLLQRSTAANRGQ